jgi:Fur family ferric uptake transcriptional regulator
MSETARRPTRQRAAVESLLVDIGDFMSAQDLHARLRAKGEGVGLATVYRTLAAMAADGDVDMMRTSDGEAVYRRCSNGHHHHLVCRKCGRTVEVEGPAVESWTDKIGVDHGFSDVQHTLEIFGLCSGCQPKSADSPA